MTSGAHTSGNEENPVTEVISIKFRGRGKTYYFDPAGVTARTGDTLVVETSKGMELGECVKGNHMVGDGDCVQPLRPVVRRATPDDLRIAELNRKREKEALGICRELIEKHKLEMKLVDVECSFEGNKILFFFTADGRVDFRELVKDLAGVFRTRIELRQIGVRDEAKMLGGLGICGRPFCCASFLGEFQPVSIKMAKEQGLSLNPTKISGACGRLMCCLKYEQDAYEDAIKRMPKNDSFVLTPDGPGNVSDVNLLKETVNVRLDDRTDGSRCYHNCEVCVLRNGKGSRDGIQVPRERPARMVVEEKPEEFPAVVSDFLYSSPEAAEPPAEEKRESGRSGRNRRRRGSRPAEDRAPEKNPPKAQKQPPKQSEKQADKQTDKPRPPRRRGGQKPEGAAPQAAKPQPPKQAAGGEVKKPRHRSGRRHPRRGPGGSGKTEA